MSNSDRQTIQASQAYQRLAKTGTQKLRKDFA